MEVIRPTLTGWAQVTGGTGVAVAMAGIAVFMAGIMLAVGGITIAAGPQAERISIRTTPVSNKKRVNFIKNPPPRINECDFDLELMEQ